MGMKSTPDKQYNGQGNVLNGKEARSSSNYTACVFGVPCRRRCPLLQGNTLGEVGYSRRVPVPTIELQIELQSYRARLGYSGFCIRDVHGSRCPPCLSGGLV